MRYICVLCVCVCMSYSIVVMRYSPVSSIHGFVARFAQVCRVSHAGSAAAFHALFARVADSARVLRAGAAGCFPTCARLSAFARPALPAVRAAASRATLACRFLSPFLAGIVPWAGPLAEAVGPDGRLTAGCNTSGRSPATITRTAEMRSAAGCNTPGRSPAAAWPVRVLRERRMGGRQGMEGSHDTPRAAPGWLPSASCHVTPRTAPGWLPRCGLVRRDK